MDGIILTPDGIGFNDWVGEPVVEEYKCTARSCNNDPAENTGWMMQVKAYCRVMGFRHAVMRVLYLNGDYRSNRDPTPKTYLLTFTDTELDENWAAIVAYAKDRGLI
jgi:hypothetical protein